MKVYLIVDSDAARDTLRKLLPKNIGCEIYDPFIEPAMFSLKHVTLWPTKGNSLDELAEKLMALPSPPARIARLEIEESRPAGWNAAVAETGGMLADFTALESWINAQSRLIWPAEQDIKLPFKCLGHNRGKYFFLPRGVGQIVELGPKDFTGGSFIHLNPDGKWWKDKFAKKNAEGMSTGFSEEKAREYLMKECQQIGVFDPAKIRGRGVWMDTVHGKKTAVVHAGNRVLAEGRSYQPYDVPGKAVYEIGRPLIHDETALPLTDGEGRQLMTLMADLGWKRAEYAQFFIGWLVCAIAGGALDWRPHIWVSGRRGSGKTTVVEMIPSLLGSNYISLQGFSSEAGIRQSLASDSLPVLLDEAEREDAASAARLQQVLQLMRGGRTAKGTPSGKALTFEIRSCFAFSSINSSATRAADKSRITVLELDQLKMMSADIFKDWKVKWYQFTQGNFADRLYARVVMSTPTIRHNAQILSRIISTVVGEQRMGDQIGTLLAGAWSITNPGPISDEAAKKFLDGINLSEQRAELDVQSDEQMLFDHIMESVIEMHGGSNRDKRSVGELVFALAGPRNPWNYSFSAETADITLKQYGMRVEDGELLISNTHTGIAKLLAKTRWENVPWSRPLARMTGARHFDKVIWFAGSSSRALRIPLKQRPEPPSLYRASEPKGQEEILLPFEDIRPEND